MLTPPLPEPEKFRIQEAALRRRLLTGVWQQDALDRMADFFAPEVRDMLPPTELSHNPFATTHQQLSTLYDEDPELEEGHTAGDTTPLITVDLWPLCQERLLYQSAVNECAMRIDIHIVNGVPSISYRVVYPDMIVKALANPSGLNPQTPVYIEELRVRTLDASTIWTRETWDVTDPEAPVFRIEALSENGKVWVDVTTQFAGAIGWPDQYRDRAGKPVFPYVLYHRNFGGHLWNTHQGYELALGTLTVAAVWTMWLAGLRDGSHPQRVLLDGEVPVNAVNSTTGAQVVRMNPQTILQVRAVQRPDKSFSSPSVTQWQPAMDPKTFGESISEFEASLAVHAGLSPSDVQKGHDAMSGYAIVVSRKGQTKAARKLVKPSKLGDQQLLAKAAALYNRAVGIETASENPADYCLEYPALEMGDLTHEEKEELERKEEAAEIEALKAKLEIATAMIAAGLLDTVGARALLSEPVAEVYGPAAATVTPPDVMPVLHELDAALEVGDLVSAAELAQELRSLLADAAPEVSPAS